MKSAFYVVVSVLALFNSSAIWAGDAAPQCMDRGQSLAVNNQQIVAWKHSQPNQFRARGHVSGPVTRVFSDASGHHHFEISLGATPDATIEVIYNEDFGSMPNPQTNDQIEACGDFIMASAQSGPYPPSPSGAIIHWVHISPDLNRHDSGFVMINGQLYGQDLTHANDNYHGNSDNNGNRQNQQNPGSHHHHH